MSINTIILTTEYVGFEILTAVTMQRADLFVVIP
jgi:hypothetical protein